MPITQTYNNDGTVKNTAPVWLPEVTITSESDDNRIAMEEATKMFPFKKPANWTMPMQVAAEKVNKQRNAYAKERIAELVYKRNPYERGQEMDKYLSKLSDYEKRALVGTEYFDKATKTNLDKISNFAAHMAAPGTPGPAWDVKSFSKEERGAPATAALRGVEGVFGITGNATQMATNKAGLTDFKSFDGTPLKLNKTSDASPAEAMLFDATNLMGVGLGAKLVRAGSKGLTKMGLKPTTALTTPSGFQNRVFNSNIQLGTYDDKWHLSELGYNYRTLSQREIESIRNTGGVFPRSGKAKGGIKNVKYWTKGNEINWYGDQTNSEVIRVNQSKFSNDKIVDANDVEVLNRQTGKFEPISNKTSFKSEIDWAKWNKDTPNHPELMQEYHAIEQQAKADGSWMKNPDGTPFEGIHTDEFLKKTGLSKEDVYKAQFIQSRSKKLKEFLGKSKVVNESGSPRITSHTTDAVFNEFSLDHFGRTDDGFHGKGIYFAPYSRKYTATKEVSPGIYKPDKIADYPTGGGYGPIDYPSYLRIENPMPKETSGFFGRSGKGSYWKTKGVPLEDIGKVPVEDLQKRVVVDDVTTLWKGKHDGNIVRHHPAQDVSEYVTHPENIKSALGNVGFFDRNNLNMHKMFAGATGLATGLAAATQAKASKPQEYRNGGRTKKESFKEYQARLNALSPGLGNKTDDYFLRGAYKGGLEPGLGADGEYHLGSRNPKTGRLLKSPKHFTWDKLLKGEKEAGYEVYKKRGKYFSKPQEYQTGGATDNEEYARQLKEHGIIDSQRQKPSFIRDRLSKNLSPRGYSKPVQRFLNAVVFNSRDLARDFEIPSRMDAFNLYTGKPQENNTFGISKYTPPGEKAGVYYNLNNTYDGHDFRRTYLINNLNTSKGGSLTKSSVDSDWDGGVMGRYTPGEGEDEHGTYLSYKDRWDLNPFNLKIPGGKEITTDFGKPFDIYDRIYYKKGSKLNSKYQRQYYSSKDLFELNPSDIERIVKNNNNKNDPAFREIIGLREELKSRGYRASFSNLHTLLDTWQKNENFKAKTYSNRQEVPEAPGQSVHSKYRQGGPTDNMYTGKPQEYKTGGFTTKQYDPDTDGLTTSPIKGSEDYDWFAEWSKNEVTKKKHIAQGGDPNKPMGAYVKNLDDDYMVKGSSLDIYKDPELDGQSAIAFGKGYVAGMAFPEKNKAYVATDANDPGIETHEVMHMTEYPDSQVDAVEKLMQDNPKHFKIPKRITKWRSAEEGSDKRIAGDLHFEEIYTDLFHMRKQFGLKPGDKITEKMVNDYYDSHWEGDKMIKEASHPGYIDNSMTKYSRKFRGKNSKNYSETLEILNKGLASGEQSQDVPMAEMGGPVGDQPSQAKRDPLRKYPTGGPTELVDYSDLHWTPTELDVAKDRSNLVDLGLYCIGNDCLNLAQQGYDKTAASTKGVPTSAAIREYLGLESIAVPGITEESSPEDKAAAGQALLATMTPEQRAYYEKISYMNLSKGDASADSWDYAGYLKESGKGVNYYSESDHGPFPEYIKSFKDPNDFYKNIPVGAVFNYGDARGSRYMIEGNANEKQGLVPSRHSAYSIGWDETGTNILADYGEYRPFGEYQDRLTNISWPHIVSKNTREYFEKEGLLRNNPAHSGPYTPNIKKAVSGELTDLEGNPVKGYFRDMHPFANQIGNVKQTIMNRMKASGEEYDKVADYIMAIAMQETKGGTDWEHRVQREIPFKGHPGDTHGLTQLNINNILKDPALAELAAEYDITSENDLLDPRKAAVASMIYGIKNLRVSANNAKKGSSSNERTYRISGAKNWVRGQGAWKPDVDLKKTAAASLILPGAAAAHAAYKGVKQSVFNTEEGPQVKILNWDLKESQKRLDAVAPGRYKISKDKDGLRIDKTTKGNNLELSDIEKFAYNWQSPTALVKGDASGKEKNKYVESIIHFYNQLRPEEKSTSEGVPEFEKGGPTEGCVDCEKEKRMSKRKVRKGKHLIEVEGTENYTPGFTLKDIEKGEVVQYDAPQHEQGGEIVEADPNGFVFSDKVISPRGIPYSLTVAQFIKSLIHSKKVRTPLSGATAEAAINSLAHYAVEQEEVKNHG